MRKTLMAVSMVALISGTTPALARDHDHHDFDRHEHHERFEHRGHRDHDGAWIGALLGTGLVLGALGHSYHTHTYYQQPTVYYEPAPVYYAQPRYVANYVAPPVEPITYVDENSGQYCREYTRQVQIGGRVQESYGTACLQPDGAWRVVQ